MLPLRPQVVAAAQVSRHASLPRGCHLSAAIVLMLLFAVSTTTAGAAPARPSGYTTRAAALEGQILATLNRVRTAHGLAALRRSPALTAAAREHSSEMARRGYFGHDSPSWNTFAARLSHFYPQGSRTSWAVGENLLWSTSPLDATAALDMWLTSSKHRRIIFTARWRELGVGVVHAVSAPGVYGGRDVVIITTDFGVRR
jgi:uncharacterized protein YkwD